MGITLIYFGKRGGGSYFAKAVFDALKSDSTRLFISEKNSDFEGHNIEPIRFIPSGIFQNVILILRFRKKKRLIDALLEKIGNDTVIFLMPHPLDFPLRKRMRRNQIFTVLHDAKKHSGDIWPTNLTIRKLGKSPGTKIFLSKHVKDSAKKYTKGPSLTLPLLMGKSSVAVNVARDVDIAFLGRHKKYKDIKFQVALLKNLTKNYKIYFSAPKKIKENLGELGDIVVQKSWLTTTEFQSVLLRTKTLLLTHSEASQSGLILDAIKFGACPVIPNIQGLNEQANHFNIPWVYNPADIVDAERQIKHAITNPELLLASRKILDEDSKIWASYFCNWIS